MFGYVIDNITLKTDEHKLYIIWPYNISKEMLVS